MYDENNQLLFKSLPIKWAILFKNGQMWIQLPDSDADKVFAMSSKFRGLASVYIGGKFIEKMNLVEPVKSSTIDLYVINLNETEKYFDSIGVKYIQK